MGSVGPLFRRLSFATIAVFTLSLSAPGVALADDGPLAAKLADLEYRVFSPEALESVVATGTTASGSGEEVTSVQVNSPDLDHIETFVGTRPFEFSIQSETSHASFNNNVVVGYNSSAGSVTVRRGDGTFGGFSKIRFSAYSFSQDGGRTFTSGFVPEVPGSLGTFGDPSVGVDRRGNFFYASLGINARDQFGIIVNKSVDGGRTFAPAAMAAIDEGSDKEWLAVGRDPSEKDQDNVYVAWTSFQIVTRTPLRMRSELRFIRSTDGGATWSAQRVLFAPTDTAVTSRFIQFANPVVDQKTGRLFIPFLHFSNIDADFIRLLVSDDGGQTFRFLRFDISGAPDPFSFPNVTPGTLADCGSGGFRLVMRSGPNLGGGRLGLPRFRQATRIIAQPSAAAGDGRLFIALNSSTSTRFGDPGSRSIIRLLFSRDGGATFADPVTVAAATAEDPQHFHPAIAVDEGGGKVSVAYYVQQSDGLVRVDVAKGDVQKNTVRFRAQDVETLSPAFALTPSNNPLPTAQNPFATTNYDRLVVACYDLGEYLSVTSQSSGSLTSFGDNRNSWTSPAGSPAAGTHSQPDVFFAEVD